MLGKLFLLFTIVPVIELYLLITLGGVLGAEATVGIVLTTGLLGAWLARKEGTRVWRQWQLAVSQGQSPKEGVVSSLLVLVGGVLLVTPGVLTDLFGMSLLIPPSRRVFAKLLSGYVEKRFKLQPFDPGSLVGSDGPVIDVDAADVVEHDDDNER